MSLSGAQILLVEDNLALADNITEILEDEGGDVIHAKTGQEARELATGGFDIALIDVRLPDSTGLDLLRELKSAENGIHEILLVTGNATIQDAIEAVKGGAYDYIVKPFHVPELLTSVERAWRQVRSSHEAQLLIREIAQREKSLRTLVDTVQALLLVLDEQGRVVQANTAVAEVTGLTPEELAGMEWIPTFVPEAERSETAEVFHRLVNGDSQVGHENRVVNARGTRERLIRWQSSAVERRDGSLRVYASGLDVTTLRELEARTQLAERLAAVGTLAAGLAHEIRNPLNSALLQLQLLDRRLRKALGSARPDRADRPGPPDDKLLEPIRLVRDEIIRLSQLVREFLDFARPRELDVESCDLVELVNAVVELERPAMSACGISVTLSTPEQAIQLTADRGKVQQVLLNLLRNAVEVLDHDRAHHQAPDDDTASSDARAEPAGPREIHIEIIPDGTGAILRVSDTGPGIPPDVLGRIFEPFFSTKEQGTGLGMAICHSIITQHGGNIRAYNGSNGGDAASSEAHGAVFEVTLLRVPPG